MNQSAAKYGLVILAAGSSSRLGRPKQLINFKGKSLLHHVIDEANLAVDSKVIVVTGANRELLETGLSQLPVLVTHNAQWRQGMASSIQCGLTALLKIYPDLDGVIFAVCDQPFVSTALFQQLIAEHERSQKGIIAGYYNGVKGVPAFFSKKYFDEMVALKGSEGAKILFSRYADDVGKVNFSEGVIDIDTEGDYENLLSV